ncbi:EAL domain-containing protein [Spongiibacter sp. KMU-166]|uniref:EAL domain-containing protein n=1 Tax=Spongiibacter thalassae TaxID=2721624 RepID=A0ABX1GGK7_9GAMM|nr:EAL domain-containing protein [Spongiibacter thalassae]NKI17517.1 EAL domain-containing protein [Spongiibacter thalassae]
MAADSTELTTSDVIERQPNEFTPGVFYLAFEHSPVPCLITDERLGILRANYCAREMLGSTVDLTSNNGRRNHLGQYIVKGAKQFFDWVEEIGIVVGERRPFELALRARESVQPVHVYMERIELVDGITYHFCMPYASSQQGILGQGNLYRTIYENSRHAIYITDKDKKVVAANNGFTELFGIRETEIVGLSDRRLYAKNARDGYEDEIVKSLEEKNFWKGRVSIVDKNRRHVDCNVTVSIVDDERSGESLCVYMLENISDQVRIESELVRSAQVDTLTGICNRAGFNANYARMFGDSQRSGEPLYLLFIDLDNFKQINDRYGHDYGDELLIKATQRIKNCLRESDFLARLGGDEFVVLITGDAERDGVKIIADKICTGLAKPFTIRAVKHTCGASVGIAQYPEDALTSDGLVQAADSAMYQAKSAGKNRAEFYNPNPDNSVLAIRKVKNEVDIGIKNKKLQPYYQSVHDMRTGEIVGYESLVRLVVDDKVFSPSYFFSSIESGPLMAKMGTAMFSDVYQGIDVMESYGIDVPVSINLSGSQLHSEEVLDHIEFLCSLNRSLPTKVNIEVSEATVCEDSEIVARHLNRLIELGFKIVLDDFGAGTTSLYTLQKYPYANIKLDRRFLDGIEQQGNPKADLLSGIIVLADALGISVIGEGVENENQARMLVKAGCILGQGFLYSEPLPLEQVLENSRNGAAT